jgi:hypothetical protein
MIAIITQAEYIVCVCLLCNQEQNLSKFTNFALNHQYHVRNHSFFRLHYFCNLRIAIDFYRQSLFFLLHIK